MINLPSSNMMFKHINGGYTKLSGGGGGLKVLWIYPFQFLISFLDTDSAQLRLLCSATAV